MPALDPAVVVTDLHFRYRSSPSPAPVLAGIDLVIDRGSRCLVIGANGAGKTTLLRIIGGKHMVDADQVRVLGRSAFHDTSLAGRVELLGGRFGFEVDLRVAEIVAGVLGADPARTAHLVELLGVDLEWHMHAVSDGQRRRVQLLLGLMRPRELLLLDEITTDLDLLARQDLLGFLRDEAEQRGATILYATHILDSLEDWATHLLYLVAGQVRCMARLGDIPELVALRERHHEPLLQVVEAWLRRDTTRR